MSIEMPMGMLRKMFIDKEMRNISIRYFKTTEGRGDLGFFVKEKNVFQIILKKYSFVV